jgi:Ca-activated chloride channel family protein
MTFGNQTWLYLTPALVLLVTGLVVFGLRRRETLLGRFAATRLLGQLTEKASQQRTLIKVLLVLLAFTMIGIALSRPQYGVEWTERKARGLDIVFVLDTSKSMLATDLRPTRLDRAKLAIKDLVQRLESDRIGLVAFAGNAFLQTPPTLDYSAFRESLDSIGPTTMTRGGSNIGKAIEEAAKAFPKDNNFKVVILLTDGEDLAGNAIESARKAAEDGIKVYAIGIGTPEGEYLRVRNAQGTEEFVRDSEGQPVRSQLDEATLQQIAQLTGGSYSRLSIQSLSTLYSSVLETLPRKERESELQEAHIERFQWALAAACIFLVFDILIRRRGKRSINAALILAGCLSFTPSQSEAQDEGLDSDVRPAEISHSELSDARLIYNQGHAIMAEGDYTTARQSYQKAIESTHDLNLQRDALYNMAHAVNQIAETALQSQDTESAIAGWKEAEALFKAAHEIDPSDLVAMEDAEGIVARRNALEAFLKKQEEQNQEQQEGDNSEPSEDGDQGEQQQESGEQQPSEQPSSKSQESQSEQQSGEEGSESGETQPPQNQDGEGEPSKSESESESAPQESEQPSPGSGEESTRDPVDDMPQPQAGEQSNEESGEEQEGSAMPPAAGTAGEGSESDTATQADATQVEGMSITDARALLDSLRDSEEILPFVEQAPSGGPTRDSRDW